MSVDTFSIPFLSHAHTFLPSSQDHAAILVDAATRLSTPRKVDRITSRMPVDAWDSHMHVTSPKYLLASNAAYTPSLYTMDHVRSFENTIGIRKIILVQPSIYGDDNSCLLDALKEAGPQNARGVVGINPDNVDKTNLEEWHRLGVRGVRLNLKSNETQFTELSLREMLHKYADVVRPLDWVLELFLSMEAMPMLERIAPELDVKISIAHFGAPKFPSLATTTYPLDPYQLEGFQSLVNLVRMEKTWVKFSAPYRFERDPQIPGIEAIARELLQKAGDRIVFASDWPHTRFDGLDIKPFVEKCLDWTDEVGLTEQVFSLNAKELWDI